MPRPSLAAAGTLTAAAGVLHLLAARGHTGTPLLAAAFVVAGVAQLALPAALRRWPEPATEALLLVDLAALGAWAVSRSVGLPGLGVEPVTSGDLAVVLLEAVAVAIVLLPRLATVAARPVLPVIAALIAVAAGAPAAGHPHADDHDDPAATPVASTVVDGADTTSTGVAVVDAAGAAAMKARMTGRIPGPAPAPTAPDGDPAHADTGAPHGH